MPIPATPINSWAWFSIPKEVLKYDLADQDPRGWVLQYSNRFEILQVPLLVRATYRQVSNKIRASGLQIVDHSYVVGASPVGATPTTLSFSI